MGHHCELPCEDNWSGDIDGEHAWSGKKVFMYIYAREHCRYCDDERCTGREYVNPLIGETVTEWTWKTIDYSKAEVGDIIADEYSLAYIVGIEERRNRESQISPERRIILGEYRHTFHSKDMAGAGYSFDVYSDGRIYRNMDTFHRVLDDPEYVNDGIVYNERSFTDAAVIRCRCGNEVELYMVMTNTCDKCQRDYNSSGQLLAPREQWGWDTGETVSDILASDWAIGDPIPGREEFDY